MLPGAVALQRGLVAAPRAVLQRHHASIIRQQRHGGHATRAAASAAAAAPERERSSDSSAAAMPSLSAAPAPVLPRLLEAAARLASEGPLEVDVIGSARHLGVGMEWRLSFSTDGSFREELISPQTCCSSGYAAPDASTAASSSSSSAPSSSSTAHSSSSGGGGGSSGAWSGAAAATAGPASSFSLAPGMCWGSDDAGCSRQMQLDDEEALLLSTWIRTGLWVLPSVAAQLSMQEVPAPPGGSDWRLLLEDEEEWEVEGGRHRQQAQAAVGGGGTTWVELRIKGGLISALVELCATSGRPISAQVQLAGAHELWGFAECQEWQPGLWLAAAATQGSSGEGGLMNDYCLHSLELSPAPGQPGSSSSSISTSSSSSIEGSSSSGNGNSGSGSHIGSIGGRSSGSRFAPPPSPLLPADTIFIPGHPEGVPAWHTVSGHSLVMPLLNGKEVGFFILDTGASGFVLDPQAADALGLEAFGELQVISMVGRVDSRFRRADTFQLGPLRMERPLFMELPCSGIVTGVPHGGRVVGIVGYDVLRRAVVHWPPHPRRPSMPRSATSVIDSPAAAVAAKATAAKLRNGPLKFTVRLQHPADAEFEAAAELGGAASRDSIGNSSGSGSSSGGSSTSSQAAHGPVLASGSTSSTAAAVAAGSTPHAPAADVPLPASPHTSGSRKEGVRGSLRSSSNSSSSSSGRRQRQPWQDPLEPQLHWLPLVMVSSLPHVELELVTAEGHRHKGLFMMDSGAGGFDLIIGAQAAQSMRLGAAAADGGPGGGVTQIKGVGGDGSERITARRCQLAEVRLGSWRFPSVQALYHGNPSGSGGGGAGLELSRHTSGIVCAGLLGRCGLTYDYARMRVAVTGPPPLVF